MSDATAINPKLFICNGEIDEGRLNVALTTEWFLTGEQEKLEDVLFHFENFVLARLFISGV